MRYIETKARKPRLGKHMTPALQLITAIKRSRPPVQNKLSKVYDLLSDGDHRCFLVLPGGFRITQNGAVRMPKSRFQVALREQRIRGARYSFRTKRVKKLEMVKVPR